MDTLGRTVLGIYGVITAILLVLIVILIVRRIKIRKKEDFEKRDN